MELYELIIYAVALLSSIVGMVRLVFTMLKRAAEREGLARAGLEKALHEIIEVEKGKASAALFRIGTLEGQRTADLALIEEQNKKINELKAQIGTLLKQMATMQESLETVQEQLENERRENERLIAENKRLEKLNGDLFETSKGLQIENKTFREAVALLGLKLADDEPEPPGPKTPKSSPLRSERIA
jgi:peptidoglycan hydrolase CwlO-like protein